MNAGKNPLFMIIYTSGLIICASLKEISLIVSEELMPQDLGDIQTSATLYASHFVGANKISRNNTYINFRVIL
jgi:hypothetical protein